jgi:uncharacterized protein
VVFIGRRHYLGIGLIGIAVAQASSTDALPPPVEQYSANCAALSYASDQLVCGNPALLDLDRQLVAALADAGQAAITPASPMIEAQPDWFKRRSLCAMKAEHNTCLTAAYGERIAVLISLTEGADQYGKPYKCSGSTAAKIARFIVKADRVVLAFRDKALIAVARPASDPGSWLPFVSATAGGKYLTIRSIAGTTGKCRAVFNKSRSSN